MKTAKQLKKEYEKNLKELQDECKHPKTHWKEEWWAPVHLTGRDILICDTCWKVLKYKMNCIACGKKIITEKDITACQDDTLCIECKKKGKYCSCHRKFYSKDKEYCPDCYAFMDAVEKVEKGKK